MALLKRRPSPDARQIGPALMTLGLYRTLPVAEIRQIRKDWTKSWRKTPITIEDFLVDRYGVRYLDGKVFPTKGVAARVPLFWDPQDDAGRSDVAEATAHNIPRD